MRTVLFIPIKLNNQRLPGKNTMLLDGRPLCEYLFRTVTGLKGVAAKYVYCSDEAICPYIIDGLTFLKRDKGLDSPTTRGLEIIDAFVHTVDADVYILTHVTQPFTKAESLQKALDKVLWEGYDSAFSASVFQDYCWYEGKPLNYLMDDIVLTQDLEPVYVETGAFFIFRKEVFLDLHRRIGKRPYICAVDSFEAIDIDTPEDFEFARAAARYLSDRTCTEGITG